MEAILSIVIFITGIFFGSFFTLAVYRIPRKEDILIKHSYCPNCNHKLGFFDLFPIFSYLLLGGKCRYCKSKIRPRYLILELLSGITFLLIGLTSNIANVTKLIEVLFTLVYISILFIISGIDKENIKIEKSVVFCGYVLEVIYIIYQCALGNINVYQYIIYLLLIIFLLVLSNISLKKYIKEKYYIQNLYLCLYIIIFCGSKIFILTDILCLISIAIYKIISQNNKVKTIPIGFYLCICNIVVIIVTNILLKL